MRKLRIATYILLAFAIVGFAYTTILFRSILKVQDANDLSGISVIVSGPIYIILLAITLFLDFIMLILQIVGVCKKEKSRAKTFHYVFLGITILMMAVLIGQVFCFK